MSNALLGDGNVLLDPDTIDEIHQAAIEYEAREQIHKKLLRSVGVTDPTARIHSAIEVPAPPIHLHIDAVPFEDIIWPEVDSNIDPEAEYRPSDAGYYKVGGFWLRSKILHGYVLSERIPNPFQHPKLIFPGHVVIANNGQDVWMPALCVALKRNGYTADKFYLKENGKFRHPQQDENWAMAVRLE